ncbi:oma-2, partial [Symbiodinium pilosum]
KMGSPPAAETLSNPIVAAQLSKTKWCIQFQRGACKERRCRFAHSWHELRTPPDLAKTAICRAFLRGQCAEADCRFAHGDEELRVSPCVYKTQLCNFFTRGHCKKGERCRHAHGLKELRKFQDGASVDAMAGHTPGLIGKDTEGDSHDYFSTPKKETVRAPPGLHRTPLQDVSNRIISGDSPDIFKTPKKAIKEDVLISPAIMPMKVPMPGQTPVTGLPGSDSPALSWPDEDAVNPDLSSEQLAAAAAAAAISAQEHTAAANALQGCATALVMAQAAVQRGSPVDYQTLLSLLSKQNDLVGRDPEGGLPEPVPAPPLPKSRQSKSWVV